MDSDRRLARGVPTNGVIVFTTASTAATALAAHAGFGPWGFGFPWFLVFIPLFWILVIGLLFAFAGRRWRRGAAMGYGPYGAHAAAARGAEATLAERFARGDIEEVEYRARLEVLRANAAAGR